MASSVEGHFVALRSARRGSSKLSGVQNLSGLLLVSPAAARRGSSQQRSRQQRCGGEVKVKQVASSKKEVKQWSSK